MPDGRGERRKFEISLYVLYGVCNIHSIVLYTTLPPERTRTAHGHARPSIEQGACACTVAMFTASHVDVHPLCHRLSSLLLAASCTVHVQCSAFSVHRFCTQGQALVLHISSVQRRTVPHVIPPRVSNHSFFSKLIPFSYRHCSM